MGYAIELQKEEALLLAKIELDPAGLDHGKFEMQAPLVLGLLKSLTDRHAIPKVRIRYWTDPEFQPGRHKTSHKGLFERNGTNGQDIYTHPHFLQYLRYFLFGAQLPQKAIGELEEAIGNPLWVSSGEIPKITKVARRLARDYGLAGKHEEFYRLALDIGLSQSIAQNVREAVKKTK